MTSLKAVQMCNFGRRSFHRWLAPTLREMKRRKDKMGPEEQVHRNTFLEWNYNAELYAFGKRLGEDFEKDYLLQALTEKSYIIKEEEKQKEVGIEPNLMLQDNDGFIEEGEDIISNFLKNYFKLSLPKLPQKHLNSIHDYLLSEDVLALVGKNIGMDDIMLCAEFPVSKKTVARGMKSVIHALALSSGEDRANNFIRDMIVTQISGKDLTALCTPENPIEELNEYFVKNEKTEPEPRLIGNTGPNGLLAVYYVGIYAEKKLIGKGFGETVAIAKDMAACDALWQMWGITLQRKPFNFSLELPPKK